MDQPQEEFIDDSGDTAQKPDETGQQQEPAPRSERPE